MPRHLLEYTTRVKKEENMKKLVCLLLTLVLVVSLFACSSTTDSEPAQTEGNDSAQDATSATDTTE